MSRLDRITTVPDICHGQPTIRGLRYPVESLLFEANLGLIADAFENASLVEISEARVVIHDDR